MFSKGLQVSGFIGLEAKALKPRTPKPEPLTAGVLRDGGSGGRPLKQLYHRKQGLQVLGFRV